MKKIILLVFSVLFLSITTFILYNQELNFNDITEVNTVQVKTITLINSESDIPQGTIEDLESVKKVIAYLKSSQYKRAFFIRKPEGNQYSLSFEDVSNHNSTAIVFIKDNLAKIDQSYYYIDKYLSRKILTYLILKGVIGQANVDFAKPINDSIMKIINRYGESRLTVENIQEDVAENNHGPMFFIQAKGDFKKGKLHAERVFFSMLVGRPYIWAIRAVDSQNNVVWEDFD